MESITASNTDQQPNRSRKTNSYVNNVRKLPTRPITCRLQNNFERVNRVHSGAVKLERREDTDLVLELILEMSTICLKQNLKVTGINSFELNSDDRNFLPSIETAVSQFTSLGQKRRVSSAKRISVALPSQNDAKSDEQIRMRYTHGVQDEALRMTEDRFQKMTLQYHDFGDDSVDVVFDANDPSNLDTETSSKDDVTTCTNIEITSSSRKGSTASTNLKTRETSSPVTRKEVRSFETEREARETNDESTGNRTSPSTHDIEELCSEDFLKININLDDLINDGKESNNGSESVPTSANFQKRKRKFKHQKKKKNGSDTTFQLPPSFSHGGSINPDIHRNVYIRALQDARVKYFRRVYPGLSTTEAYKFSYFDVCNKIEEHKERYRREKDFRNYVGMKRIFGDIKMDDYYASRYSLGAKQY